jgi:hypothetical protein
MGGSVSLIFLIEWSSAGAVYVGLLIGCICFASHILMNNLWPDLIQAA